MSHSAMTESITTNTHEPISPAGTDVREQDEADPLLTPEILALAAVVILGAIMTILDATIVNVALPTLGRDFHASVTTIQWVPTIYLLAFASVIPLTGWTSERFGAKTVWLASLGAFMLGSLLAGLAPSIGALIAFRILQGLGGGMIMPLGQTILARAAGPQRLGRVMSIVGVPMFLAPIFGPVIGGALIGTASWRWIFLVNLPVGALALALALWLLPSAPRRPTERLDTLGLGLLAGGIVLFVYGLAAIGSSGTVSDPTALAAMVAGVALAAGFWRHALRVSNPLIDVRLFTQRGFATAAIATLVLGVPLFGAMLLLPLYFQIVRGQSPLETGILLIPQGLGAAVAMPIAGMLTDKIGARQVVLAAIGLALAGVAGYTQVTTTTPFWLLAAALFVMGAGLGSIFTPLMAVAFRGLTHQAMPRATSAINVIQRLAGSLGTALLAVVLQRSIAANLPGFHGGLTLASALATIDPVRTTPALAHAFGTTFWVAFGLAALALIPALLLPTPPRLEQQ